jgi:hypothetical protein
MMICNEAAEGTREEESGWWSFTILSRAEFLFRLLQALYEGLSKSALLPFNQASIWIYVRVINVRPLGTRLRRLQAPESKSNVRPLGKTAPSSGGIQGGGERMMKFYFPLSIAEFQISIQTSTFTFWRSFKICGTAST